MPHASLKLIPGVDTTKTPALNEAAISSSNLIRFLPDRNSEAVPQKMGGWVQYYSLALPTKIRALKGWEDLRLNLWLGVGCEGGLYAISNGIQSTISPQISTSTVAPWSGTALNFFATSGSNIIHVIDTSATLNAFSYANFLTPVSVGGVVLIGTYPISQQISATEYTVLAAANASYTTNQTATSITVAAPAVVTVASTPDSGTPVIFTTTGALPTGLTAGTKYYVKKTSSTQFNVAATVGGASITTTGTQSGTHTAYFPATTRYLSTQSASSTVDVIFPYSNASVSSTQSFYSTVSVGGLSISGDYTVYQNLGVDEFNFVAQNAATSSATAFDNSGSISMQYFIAATPGTPSTAFGANAFGSGSFGGISVPGTSGTGLGAADWFLDNWGEQLIACPVGGALYYWQPNGAIPNAQYIQNAPISNNGVFVAMPQRQLVAWGSSFTSVIDPLMVRWSDVENYTTWTARSTNQAGSYRIPSGSRIISGMQAMQQGLFWTDLDLWSMQYIGPPGVYGFNKISTNCGLIAPKAAGQMNNMIYWMSQKQFYMMGGQGAIPLACPVWDVIFQNLDQNNVNKIRCAPNTTFNEIFWFYPSSSGGGEVDSYVKLNIVLNQWDYGLLGRTAWIDQSALGLPIGAGTDNILYQHETGYSAAGQTMNSTFTTGYFSAADADQMVFIDQIWPDMKFGPYNSLPNETIYITVNATYYPTDTPISYGPYAMTQGIPYINCRVRGRLFSITIQSNNASETFWRLGRIRYRYAQDGKF